MKEKDLTNKDPIDISNGTWWKDYRNKFTVEVSHRKGRTIVSIRERDESQKGGIIK